MEVVLEVGMRIGPWTLIRELTRTEPRKWVCECARCRRVDSRLAGHLLTNTQPGCGKCRSAGGVKFAGRDAMRKVAERNGSHIDDREMWAFENCDDNLEAQKIVDWIIARETAIMRAERERRHDEEMRRKGQRTWWTAGLPRNKDTYAPVIEDMEVEDDY